MNIELAIISMTTAKLRICHSNERKRINIIFYCGDPICASFYEYVEDNQLLTLTNEYICENLNMQRKRTAAEFIDIRKSEEKPIEFFNELLVGLE